ncbi:hypothetical protein E3P94_03251 [Wallemia ichthyophaga]|nr:hypothetical protein E3P95_03246 [Wallemia ichthyophaga]TIA97580.1 hypothetical protein E3P94_03251 [Wallemia ichthyophaga]
MLRTRQFNKASQASQASKGGKGRIQIASWNILSQSLIKRELYESSDCLKIKSRLPRLKEELGKYASDVICLQEVDQLEALKDCLPRHKYASCFGTQNDNATPKKHGLVIFYRDSFTLVHSKAVSYDEHPKWPLSRKTNNVGLIAVLSTGDEPSDGIIIATTHLFWHPAFVYERTRQTYILIEQCEQMRRDMALSYPIILSGDFNSEPHELVYQSIVGGSIDDKERERVGVSRVCHASVSGSGHVPPEQGANLPITNSVPNDNAPSVDELIEAFSDMPNFISAYDACPGGEQRYSHRDASLKGRKGANEPYLTNYMPKYGMLTLDYIFHERDMATLCTLEVPHADTLTGGLPKQDTTASDHIMIAAQNSTGKLVDGCYTHTEHPDSSAVSKLISQLHAPSKQQAIGGALLKHMRAASRVYHDPRKRSVVHATLRILQQINSQTMPDGALYTHTLLIIDTALSPPIPPDLQLRELAVNLVGGVLGDVFYTHTLPQLRNTLLKNPHAEIAHECITSFHSILYRLNGMGSLDDADENTRNRTRRIALLGIEAVFESDVLGGLPVDDRRRAINLLVPPLIDNLLPGDTKLDLLEHRVLPCISNKVDDRNTDDVLLATIALRVYRTIYAHSATGRWISMCTKPTLDSFDKHKRWREVEWVCWVLAHALQWTPAHYAAYIPTTILDMLIESQDTFPTTTKQSGYLHILTHLFTRESTVNGLQVLATLDRLLAFLVRRFRLDGQDALGPMTIAAVGALAKHLYYADQISDMAGRVVVVINDVQFADTTERRDDLLRLLLCALGGVMAEAYDGPSEDGALGLQEAEKTSKASISSKSSVSSHLQPSLQSPASPTSPKGKERAVLVSARGVDGREARETSNGRDKPDTHLTHSTLNTHNSIAPRPPPSPPQPQNPPLSQQTHTRSRISPTDMASTVSLLIEPRYSVRAGYVRALAGFVQGELAAIHVHRAKLNCFLTALHAAMWVLATCRNLADVPIVEEAGGGEEADDGYEKEREGKGVEEKEKEVEKKDDNEKEDENENNKVNKHKRKNSNSTLNALARLKQMASHRHTTPSLPSNTATLTDYTHLLGLITSLLRRGGAETLLTIVPFLRALDGYAVEVQLGPGLQTAGSRRGSQASWSWSSLNGMTQPPDFNMAVDERCKCRAIRELVARCWMEIGEGWGNATVRQLARKGLDRLGGSVLGTPPHLHPAETPSFTVAPAPPLLFPSEDDWDAVHDGESSRTVTGIVDEVAAIEELAGDAHVLLATGLSRLELDERLKRVWTFDDAVEAAGMYAGAKGVADSAVDGLIHHTNHTKQSNTRHVDVYHLKEALSNRTTPNISLKHVKDKEVISLDDSEEEGDNPGQVSQVSQVPQPAPTPISSKPSISNTRKRRQPAASTSNNNASATTIPAKTPSKRKKVRGNTPPLPTCTPLPVPCDDKEGHLIILENVELDGRYRIQRLLGQGTFGKVVEAYDRLARKNVAVKIIKSIQKYRDASRIELRVLSTLRDNDPSNDHKCIEMIDWFDFKNHICIVSDLLSESVYDFLKSNKFTPFPATHIQEISYQLLKSVAYLHTLKLVHTDLKPENILLVSNKSKMELANDKKPQRKILANTDIRLIDFGSATFESEYHSSVVSTRHYRAPEIILGLGWSYPCDVFSLGCIIIELMTGEALFQTHDNLEHLAMMEVVMGPMPLNYQKKASKAKPEYFRGLKLDYPNGNTTKQSRKVVKGMKSIDQIIKARDLSSLQLIDLLQKMLTFDQDERIRVDQALEHPIYSLSSISIMSTSISNQEASLYDRQIRLWGLSAQNKIRSSHVVLVNALRGCSCEVAKNLTLAGVGKLTLIVEHTDWDNVKVDGSTAIFIRGGENNTQSTEDTFKSNINNLNPHVQVEIKSVDSYSNLVDAYKTANIVIATDLQPHTYNAIHSQLNPLTPLYLIGTLGLAGYVIVTNGSVDASGSEMVHKTLDQLTQSKPGTKTRKLREKRDLLGKWRGWLLVMAWWSWLENERRSVTTESEDVDRFYDTLLNKAKYADLIDDNPLPFTKADVAQLIPSLNTSIAPVHATLGGFIAQDVISAISSKHPGTNNAWNWLSYDAKLGVFSRLKLTHSLSRLVNKMTLSLPRGNYAPIPTFYAKDQNQSVDLSATAQHALNIVKAGVAGVVCQGSTAEWVSLNDDEKSSITQAVRKILNDHGFTHVPVLAGIGAQSTRHAIQLAKSAGENGAQYVLSLPPSYFAASLTQAALVDFYIEVATHSPVPLLIYSFPGVSNGVTLSTDTLITLAAHPKIVGIKQTDHDIGKMTRLAGLHSQTQHEYDFAVFAGASNYLVAALSVGAHGSITGAANYAPELVTAVQEAYDGGDTRRAVELQRKLAELEDTTATGGIPGIKLAACCKYAYHNPQPRHPVPLCSDTVHKSIVAAMKGI